VARGRGLERWRPLLAPALLRGLRRRCPEGLERADGRDGGALCELVVRRRRGRTRGAAVAGFGRGAAVLLGDRVGAAAASLLGKGERRRAARVRRLLALGWQRPRVGRAQPRVEEGVGERLPGGGAAARLRAEQRLEEADCGVAELVPRLPMRAPRGEVGGRDRGTRPGGEARGDEAWWPRGATKAWPRGATAGLACSYIG